MPKVSIVIPVYNVSMYLKECMDSVINQTLKDIEIICVNDGSTDNSLDILNEYALKDKRIKIISKPNSGYGHTMNIGIDNASGEYIGIVEPDDYVELEMYETLYNKAKENDLDFIKADFNRFTGEKEDIFLKYHKVAREETNYNRVINPSEEIIAFKFVMNTWSGIYKRSFLKKYNIKHNETPGASFQDNGFWFQTFCFAKRILFINKPFYMNRRDNPNSSVKSKEKVYCMSEEYSHIRTFLDKNPELKEKFIYIYNLKKYHNYSFNLRRIDPSFRPEFAELFSKEFAKALKDKELDKSLFSHREWKLIRILIKNPRKFLLKSFQRLSFIERLFSVTNEENVKILRFFGIRIPIKKLSCHKNKTSR
jgi:Glycosyltransferases involved in cell wall biogenesis